MATGQPAAKPQDRSDCDISHITAVLAFEFSAFDEFTMDTKSGKLKIYCHRELSLFERIYLVSSASLPCKMPLVFLSFVRFPAWLQSISHSMCDNVLSTME